MYSRENNIGAPKCKISLLLSIKFSMSIIPYLDCNIGFFTIALIKVITLSISITSLLHFLIAISTNYPDRNRCQSFLLFKAITILKNEAKR